ncbi:Amino acid transporter, partial [Trichostrongylus colubriformis]
LGIVIATVIHPGDSTIKEGHTKQALPSHGKIFHKIGDVLRNMFTENLIRSMFQQQQTVYKLIEKNATEEAALIWMDGMNVIGITIFSTALGAVISVSGDEARPLADFFKALDVVITRFMAAIMWLGPIGIPSMIAQKMLEVKDLVGTFRTLGLFIASVILGNGSIHGFTVTLNF